ncbi:Synembryn-A [Galemys pyrenaicus]|uniref:Synembryn n=1 Tax=Galemys pyrenaicus TaxID=202257 RepID=A0A8J6AV68_GALPY|nr:Synembryn-A [Galemys pyrenaicus]
MAGIEPVTDREGEEMSPGSMEGWTEEPKEHEAMKLVNVFDTLSRHSHPAHGDEEELMSLSHALCVASPVLSRLRMTTFVNYPPTPLELVVLPERSLDLRIVFKSIGFRF